jgi:hypothetical protein
MIIAVYIDEYSNDYIEIGETVEGVIKNLEIRTDDSNLDMNSLKVFTGVQLKVIKSVSYTVETI